MTKSTLQVKHYSNFITLELRKKFETDEESKKYKFNKLDKDDQSLEYNNRNLPKHSKSNNLDNIVGFQRKLSLENSADESKNIRESDQKPLRTARRMHTNIFSNELITSMKNFNKL